MTSSPPPSKHVLFDPPPEIFASDTSGTFLFPLRQAESLHLDTSGFDEVRFVTSIWHPSDKQSIDLDRAYVELRASFDPEDDHWTKISEIEPVVPPYRQEMSFDGWIVLPILGAQTAFQIFGAGFEPRARLQIRVSAYFVG